MITDATDDNARPPEMSANAELSGTDNNAELGAELDSDTALPRTGNNGTATTIGDGPSATVDNTAAETIRYLARELQEARRKLKANGRPAPANWQDYILGQTERSLSIEQSDKRRALIVEALASIGPQDAVGWGKQHGTMRKTKHRGIASVGAGFLLNLIAYNLIRIPKLLAA